VFATLLLYFLRGGGGGRGFFILDYQWGKQRLKSQNSICFLCDRQFLLFMLHLDT